MYRHRALHTTLALLLFAGAVLAVRAHGVRGRVSAAARSTHVVASPEQASLIWAEKGVRGRVLLLFDHYPHGVAFAPPGAAPPSPADLVAHAVLHDVVRKVYFVVPDDAWDRVSRERATYLPLREAMELAEGFHLFTLSGIPMIALPASALPPLREEPLVYVNEELFDRDRTLALLARRGVTSDVLVFRRPEGTE